MKAATYANAIGRANQTPACVRKCDACFMIPSTPARLQCSSTLPRIEPVLSALPGNLLPPTVTSANDRFPTFRTWRHRVSGAALRILHPCEEYVEAPGGYQRAQGNRAVKIKVSYFREVLMLTKFVDSFVPKPLTAVMIAMAMPAAIKPYSMAVAAVSSARNFRTMFMTPRCAP